MGPAGNAALISLARLLARVATSAIGGTRGNKAPGNAAAAPLKYSCPRICCGTRNPAAKTTLIHASSQEIHWKLYQLFSGDIVTGMPRDPTGCVAKNPNRSGNVKRCRLRRPIRSFGDITKARLFFFVGGGT